MRRLTKIKWLLTAVVVLIALVVMIAYLLTSRIPGDYKPAHLSQDQRRQVATTFINDIITFDNLTQQNKMFEWSITDEQANRYLACMDEIAVLRPRPNDKPAGIREGMDRAGFVQPAVAFDDGIVTFMVRATEHSKVISVDVRLGLVNEDEFEARITGVRVGSLPVPISVVRERLESLRGLISDGKLSGWESSAARSRKRTLTGRSIEHVANVLAVVLGGVNGTPIPAEGIWPGRKKLLRVESIDVRDNRLTLRIRPIRPVSD